jgi:flagellar hook-length control protein FliK
MQTTPISNPASLINAAPSNAATATEQDGRAFGQVLSREVAERRNAEHAQASEARQDKRAASEAGNNNGTAKADAEAATKPEAEAAPSSDKGAAEASTDAAALASAELLALVANIAQLKGGKGEAGEAAAEPEEALPGLDLAGGRKHSSPFAAIHAAIGARANHGTQSKPDGTWAAQVERGATGRIEAGKADGVLAAQLAPGEQPVLASKTAAGGGEFGAALKETGQLLQPLQQQGVVQPAQALASEVADKLSPRVGNPGWDQALGQKVVWMVKGEQQSASLTLNPPELGPLKVVLQVSNAQATATFVAAQPEVRQALEAAMPRLRDMLGEAGIQLGQASVDSGSPHQEHAAERQMRHAAGVPDSADASEPAMPTAGARKQADATGLGLVDTFA